MIKKTAAQIRNVLKQNNWAGRRPCATFDAGICIHWTWFNEFSLSLPGFFHSQPHHPAPRWQHDWHRPTEDSNSRGLRFHPGESRRSKRRLQERSRWKRLPSGSKAQTSVFFPSRIPCSATFTKDSQIPLKCDWPQFCSHYRLFCDKGLKPSICLCLFLIQ